MKQYLVLGSSNGHWIGARDSLSSAKDMAENYSYIELIIIEVSRGEQFLASKSKCWRRKDKTWQEEELGRWLGFLP